MTRRIISQIFRVKRPDKNFQVVFLNSYLRKYQEKRHFKKYNVPSSIWGIKNVNIVSEKRFLRSCGARDFRFFLGCHGERANEKSLC